MRQARDKFVFHKNDINPCIYKRFCEEPEQRTPRLTRAEGAQITQSVHM